MFVQINETRQLRYGVAAVKIHAVTLCLEKTNRAKSTHFVIWLSVLYFINISSRTTKSNIKTSLPSTMKNTSGPIEKNWTCASLPQLLSPEHLQKDLDGCTFSKVKTLKLLVFISLLFLTNYAQKSVSQVCLCKFHFRP